MYLELQTNLSIRGNISSPLRQDALALEVKKRVQLSGHGDRVANGGGSSNTCACEFTSSRKRGVGGSVGGKVVTRPA